MCSKRTTGFVLNALFFLIIVSLTFAPALASRNIAKSETLPEEITELLSDYSRNLENLADTQVFRSAYYSSEMKTLIIDRQNYYKEFFNKGLHSDLVSLESRFMDEGVTILGTENSHKVHIVEQVTMRGKPIVTSPADYPPIQAAEWAINRTNNPSVKNRLNKYIELITKGVKKSIEDGSLIVFLVNHDLEISIENGQGTILNDSFSDRSSDNGEGFDNVARRGNKLIRLKPDWQKMPDYQMYNTSIETIGENLLHDYETMVRASVTEMASSSDNSAMNRDKAVWYIRHYTSAPPIMYKCPDDSLLYRDSVFYNATYANIWARTGWECFDCTDFVSQALFHGSFLSDDEWKPDPESLAWNRVSTFGEYFSDPTKQRGSWASSLTSLTPGDVVFIVDNHYAVPWRHVVMYSSVNPSRYSGHTNDRLDYPFESTYNRFLVINYYQSIFLPLILDHSPYNLSMENFIQSPYPAPVESHQDMSGSNTYPAP
jgi:hypothetical protein